MLPGKGEPMTTLHIALSESLREFVAARVAAGGYVSASDYIDRLVREDQRRQERERVEALLMEGLQSEASEMTQADWDELKRRVWERHAKQCGVVPCP